MSTEHWQSFQEQQSFKFAESSMPVYAVEVERQRRKQGGLCSIKSLFCCLSVLVGRPSNSANKSSKKSKKRRQSQQMEVLRTFENDDDSFGYNFDEQIISPRVLKRLASDGNNFD
mmetsp:Transcript_19129/g.31208  ORF Transcript_19129/g.31208 Transcript_19129/m.31208 type:complete len:115 (-) Transcript_19129:134-478(-)|eukprot:CAMPEP_0201956314 /NCGR_PEP_ID=MMETSP0904-20121228/3744_1 /ASSEMBLY_ACC=CAM_ASM_000553 /TAXON_ID=420261 /ORGANISM="Thalassiosira antarctica, Strain CCMP982" /LENGTH=114 /DNA_ID=CAMNT_0048500773 /DNA_START=278 /DNA_END=622 /DNA_ORIENTATION=+